MKKAGWVWWLTLTLFLMVIGFSAGQVQAESWTFDAYQKASKASGRNMAITEAEFKAIQQRKEKAVALVEKYLNEKFGKADPAVVKAFREVPREYYHYNYQADRGIVSTAYEGDPKPWGIGYGSALSDYLGQAYMTQLAKPTPTDVVLEVGTGSGFQISWLSRIVKQAYSVEIIKPLGEKVGKIFEPLGYGNVHSKVADGYFGWPEVEGGFDIIMVTCAASYVSPELLKQLKPGGRMIIPLGGNNFKKGQLLYVFTKDKDGKVHSKKDMGVFFIPMTGEIQKRPQPQG
ncbi:MAG: protein-L-isoaspartate O-methyltransferase, partial [Deltaproteobacteria bacterium]|nr:protein-L-isoaspartate O-methyltransferase [Deltaproteobacteria bacterium]